MEQFQYRTSGVCARSIDVTLDGDEIVSVEFCGGCSGNTQGIGALVKGMKVEDAVARLSGIRCGFKNTSCPDQLAKALSEHLHK